MFNAELNSSSRKLKYLKEVSKIGEIDVSEEKFFIKIILSLLDNEYKGKSDFSFATSLGDLYFVVDKIPVIRIRRS